MKQTKVRKSLKRILSVLLTVVLILGTAVTGLPYLDFGTATKVSAAGTSDGKLKADANGNFKILQVADIQDSWKEDNSVNGWERTVEMIRYAVAIKKPDLIVMTGDNIGPEDSNDRLTSYNDFIYSINEIVECFQGVPFVVTYGNHDYERNKDRSTKISLAIQDAAYHNAGALTLNQTGMTISDTSENSCARYGTGYLDVYDSTGTTVIERVIVLNSSSYEGSRSPSQFGRIGGNDDSYGNSDYQNVVNAVSSWTSNSAIKCIAFQHIPMQEMFYGDSSTTTILKTDSSGYACYPINTGRFDTSAKWVKNTSNTTVTGEFHENIGQSYGSTLELFNALAGKSNVAGIFFGHEHTNTVTGVATIGGKTLRMGYGGGMLVYSDYEGDSAFSDCNPLASFYTLKNVSNTNTATTKEVLNYFNLSRTYNKSIYSNNQTYISDVRLFKATTSGTASGGTAGKGHFDEAVAKCEAAGYIPIEDTYSFNNTKDGDCLPDVADFNFDSYAYDGATGAYAVCLGYKTTTDPNQAITDLRIYYGGASDPGYSYSGQELYAGKDSNGNESSPTVTYYNSNWDNSTTIRSDGSVKFNEGLTANDSIGNYNTWLFYTKDSRAGLPIKEIFTNITDTYMVQETKKPYTGSDSDGLSMYRNCNLNKYSNEYPYSWAQYLHGTYDWSHSMRAANVKTGFTDKLKGSSSQTSCWGFIGMVHALPSDEAAFSETAFESASPVAVPETIYLTASTGNATDFQLACNNKMQIQNSKNYVSLQTPSSTMTAYFHLNNATLTSVTLSSGSTSMTTKTLTSSFSSSGGLYSASFDLSTDTSFALSSGLASGGVGTIKWTFTYTISGSTKTVNAYTTCYAPFNGSVAAIAASTSNTMGAYATGSSWTAIFGIHQILNSQKPMRITGVTENGDEYYDEMDASAVYKYNLTNCKSTMSDYVGGAAPTTSNLLASDDGSANAGSTSGTAYYYKNSSSSDSTKVYVSGGTGLITYDPDRLSTLGDVPNFYFHTYFGTFGGNAGSRYIRDIDRRAGWQMLDSSGSSVQTSKDYFSKYWSSVNPGLEAGTTSTVIRKAGAVRLSDGCRFISATSQKWENATGAFGSGSSVRANAFVNVEFDAVDKTTLRDDVAEALAAVANGATGLDTAINEACLVLGDPTSTSSEVLNEATDLEIAIVGSKQSSYLYPDTTFLAPEVIYLKATDRQSFQYFVNDCNSSYTQSIEANGSQTAGYLSFTGPSGATVTSLTCANATINGYSAGTNLSGHGFTINGNKITGVINQSGSSYSSAATAGTSNTISWTVTYTVNARGRNVTQTATAYTECYAPNQSVGTSLENCYNGRKGSTNSGHYWYTTWISGIHEIYNIDSNKVGDQLPYYSYLPNSDGNAKGYYDLISDPLTSNPHAAVARTTYFGQQNTSLLTRNNSIMNMDYYYNAYYNNGGADSELYFIGGNIAGRLYIDTSRYTTDKKYSDIPNFNLGFDVISSNCEIDNDNALYAGYDLSSGFNTTHYNMFSSNNCASIPNQYISYANGTSKDTMNNLAGNRKSAVAQSKLANNVNSSYTKLSAITFTKIRCKNNGYKVNREGLCNTYCELVYSNKQSLRTAYLTAISSGRQKEYYTTSTWTAYENALKALAKNLESVNVSANNSLVNALNTAAGNLVLKNTTVTRRYVSTDESNLALYPETSTTVPYCTDITVNAPEVPAGYVADGYSVSYNGGTAQNGTGNFSAVYSTWDSITVTFKYHRASYTMTVNPNGGTYSGTSPVTQKYKTTTTLSTPTRTGYTFSNWTVQGGGSVSGNTYTFGTSDGTVMANWTANKYLVSFNDQNSTNVNMLREPLNLTNPTQQGVTITYDRSEDVYTLNGTQTASTNTFFTIPFTPELNTTYTMSVEVIGGSKTAGNGCCVFECATSTGGQVGTDSSATRTNMDFSGTAKKTFTFTDSTKCSSVVSMRFWIWHNSVSNVYSNFQFRLKLEKASAKTNFSHSGLWLTYDSDIPTVSIPKRANYDFLGYYTGTNGTGTKYYNADGTAAATWGEAANTTLYAHWQLSNFRLNYDNLFNISGFKNGYANNEIGKTVYIDADAGTIEYTNYGVTTSLTNNTAYKIYVEPNTKYQLKYDFNSVNTYLWGEVRMECYNSSGTKILPNSDAATVYFDTANPEYTPNNLVAGPNLSALSDSNKAIVTSIIKVKDDTGDNLGTAPNNGVAYYQYTPKVWLAGYDCFVGSTMPMDDTTVDFITPAGTSYIVINFGTDPSNAGTSFLKGTFSNISLTRKSDFATDGTGTIPANTITYSSTATPFSSNTYTVNSGTVNVNTIGGTPTTSKPGYEFAGWVNIATGSVQSSFAASSNPNGMTYKSSWKRTGYKITFNLNDSTGSTRASITGVDSNKQLSYNVESTTALPTPTRAGYTFKNWKVTTAGGNWTANSTVNGGTNLSSKYGNVTLTAQWQANTYTVYADTLFDGTAWKATSSKNCTNASADYVKSDNAVTLQITSGTTGESYASGASGYYTMTVKPNTKYTISAQVYNITGTSNVEILERQYNGTTDLGFGTSGTIAAGASSSAPATFTKTITTGANTNVLTVRFRAVGSTGNKVAFKNIRIIEKRVHDIVSSRAIVSQVTFDAAYGTTTLPVLSNPNGYTFAGWKDASETTVSSSTTYTTVGDMHVYSQWTVNTYSILYSNLGDATNSTSNPSSYNIESGQITFANPTKNKTGYDFGGWNLSIAAKSPETASAFASGSVTNGTASSAATIKTGTYGNVTAAAKWSARSYSISYANITGATLASGYKVSYTIETNTFDIAAPAVNKTGYNFAGWDLTATAKEPETTTSFASGSVTTGTASTAARIAKGSYGNVTATAKWTVQPYTISYEGLGDGTNATSNPTGYNIESDTITLAAPSKNKTGYTFAGWSLTGATFASGSVTSGTASTAAKIAKGSYGNVTATAIWTKITYSISYTGLGDGTNATSNPATYNIESGAISLAAPSRNKTGYTFAGWTLTITAKSPETVSAFASGSVTNGTASTAAKIATGSYGNVTATAKWTPITYTITYDNLGDATNSTSNPATYNIESSTITLAAPSKNKTGYLFAGWTLTGATFASGSVTSGTASTAAKIATGSYGDVTATAQWTPITYTVQYNINWDGNGGQTRTIATDGGTRTFTTVTMSPLTSVTYDTTQSTEFNRFLKPGYLFVKWNTKADGTGTDVANKGTIRNLTATQGATVTLYAQWQKDTYNITYTGLTGSTVATNPSTYQIDTATFTLNNPTKTGYDFTGWKRTYNYNTWYSGFIINSGSAGQGGLLETYSSTYPSKYSDPIFIKAGSTYILSGTDKRYRVFDKDGGYTNATSSMSKDSYVYPLDYQGNNSATFSFSDSTKYTTFTVQKGNTGDMTLEATWKVKPYTITYDLNDSTGSTKATISSNVLNYNIESTDKLESPTRTGYEFTGWKVSASSGNWVANQVVAKDSYLGGTGTGHLGAKYGNVTLVAQWTAKTYTVTLDDQGATTAGSTSVTATFDSAMPSITIPKKTGYIFGGYFTEKNGAGTKYYTKDGASAHNWDKANNSTTLYAMWLEIEADLGVDEKALAVSANERVESTEIASQGKWTSRNVVGYSLNKVNTDTKDFNAVTNDGFSTSSEGEELANGTGTFIYQADTKKSETEYNHDGYLLFKPTAKIADTVNKIYAKILSKYEGRSYYTYQEISVVPQTTLFFDQDDAGTFDPGTSSGGWSTLTSGTKIAEKNVATPAAPKYGYSSTYKTDSDTSGSTDRIVNVANGQVTTTNGSTTGSWPTYTYEFTGTGCTLYATCYNQSGLMTVKVEQKSGSTYTTVGKQTAINTYYQDGDNEYLYQAPVYTKDLGYGTYRVTVTAVYSYYFDKTISTPITKGLYANEIESGDTVDLSAELGEEYANCEYYCVNDGETASSDELNISDYEASLVGYAGEGRNLPSSVEGSYNVVVSGFRIYNPAGVGATLTNTDIIAKYTEDGELNPTYIDIRTKLGSSLSLGPDSAVYVSAYKVEDEDGKEQATGGISGEWSAYTTKGANHEVILSSGGAIAFDIANYDKVNGVHISLRVPRANASSVTIGGNSTISLTSATEQFYDITNYIETITGSDGKTYGRVTIGCNSGFVSISTIKVISSDDVAVSSTQDTVDSAIAMMVNLFENPIPDKTDVTFNINFGGNTVQKTVSANKFTVSSTDNGYQLTTTLTAAEINNMFKSTGLDNEYSIKDNKDITLTAVYDGEKWVAQNVNVEILAAEATDMVFTVTFNGIGTTSITVAKEDITVTDVDGKLVATAVLTPAQLTELFNRVKPSGDYTIKSSGNVTLTAERVNGEWQTKNVQIEVQNLGSTTDDGNTSAPKTFGDRIRDFVLNIFKNLFGKLSIVK